MMPNRPSLIRNVPFSNHLTPGGMAIAVNTAANNPDATTIHLLFIISKNLLLIYADMIYQLHASKVFEKTKWNLSSSETPIVIIDCPGRRLSRN